jgi:membrane-associated protease RseP (regulator of RpoE activity)
MDTGNYVQVPIRRVVTFNFTPSAKGVIVRARAERFLPALRLNRYNKEPIANKDTFDGLLNIIALAGDTAFVPGTRFGDQGYLGFRSDRFAEIDVDGAKRIAIQVGAIDAASPAAAAGLQSGDFVLAMNGRTFDEYGEIARFLADVEPGDAVAMRIERRGQRMQLTATASSPPATLAVAN